MENGYAKFEKELSKVVKNFPTLRIVNGRKQKFLRGSFDVIDDTGKFWDSYDIEIRCSNDYPKRFPYLSEIGGKIPRITDWHIYENTGTCCITVPAKELMFCRNGITLLQFIQYHVRPYFFNQTYRRKFGVYANGEYEHGVLGKWQHYSELFKTSDLKIVIQYLEKFSIGNSKLHKKIRCICGSKRRFKKCHPDLYRFLSSADKAFLRGELEQLKLLLSRV